MRSLSPSPAAGPIIMWPSHEALHVGCAFDIKFNERRRAEILNLVSIVNEQLWIGHFGLWEKEGVIIFRHSMLLAGGAEASRGQCEAVLQAAISACERYYQAFQFVIWAGRNAREALDAALFETALRQAWRCTQSACCWCCCAASSRARHQAANAR